MVDLFGRRQLALLLALLTKGMQLDVAVTDALPRSAVNLVDVGASLEPIVFFVRGFLMRGAVLSISNGKSAAAGVSAWTLGFVRHPFFLLSGIRKATRDFSLVAWEPVQFFTLPLYHDTPRHQLSLALDF